jgi:hypothetical protein
MDQKRRAAQDKGSVIQWFKDYEALIKKIQYQTLGFVEFQ